MIGLIVTFVYLIIGVALFFAFWRFLAMEDDDFGNKFVSLMLLFFWPVTITFVVIFTIISGLLDAGKKVMKK